MSALGKPVTLAEWKAQHGADVVEVFKPALSESPNENWCARATSVHVVDSDSKATRTVYFYEPSAPERPTIPKEDSTLVDQCRSGLVSTTVDLPDSTRATSLLEKARQQIDAAIGAGQNNANVYWSGSASWTGKSLWQRDNVAVAAAIRSHGESPMPQVLVLGLGKSSGLRLDATGDDNACRVLSRTTTARIHEAIGIAALGDGEPGLRAANRIEAEECTRTASPAETSEIGNAIVGTLDSIRSLSSARRAAGLFAADQLLTRSELLMWKKDERPEIRQRLEARGATFQWDELGGGYQYAHDWLKESLRIDTDGRAGALAFLTLMERGFNTSVGCAQGADEFRVVIREGQKYLREKPESAIRLDLHFLVARAYGDIVALANGAAYGEERREYLDEIPDARTRALEEYQRWFEGASSDPRRSEGWAEAWRLAAGLSPTRTFFYCIYD